MSSNRPEKAPGVRIMDRFRSRKVMLRLGILALLAMIIWSLTIVF